VKKEFLTLDGRALLVLGWVYNGWMGKKMVLGWVYGWKGKKMVLGWMGTGLSCKMIHAIFFLLKDIGNDIKFSFNLTNQDKNYKIPSTVVKKEFLTLDGRALPPFPSSYWVNVLIGF
jgi:hypothetical protein